MEVVDLTISDNETSVTEVQGSGSARQSGPTGVADGGRVRKGKVTTRKSSRRAVEDDIR